MAKLLQTIGVLALLAWTGIGLAAWMLVKDRVQITVSDGTAAARTGSDPVALLGDQVAVLQNDLRTMADSTGRNLERLGQAMLDDAAGHAEALASLVRALPPAASAASVQALRDDVAALRTAVAALDQRVAVGTASAPAEAASAAAPVVAAPPQALEAAPPAPAPAPATAPASAPEPAAAVPPAAAEQPKPRRSFLAVPLQAQPFRFEEQRTWELLPSLSRVGFDAKSTLHDFSGVTSKVAGELTLALAAPERGVEASIEVEAATLVTGVEGRDAAMCDHLATKDHPRIRFVARSFATERVDTSARTVRGTVTGTMSIRGVDRELAMPVQLAVDESQRLVVTGEAALAMSDYGVPIPSQLGIISVTDEVKVWIALRARARPRAAAPAEAPK